MAREHDCDPCCLTHVRIPWVKKAVSVTAPARAVLWALAIAHADKETGRCWPAITTLASETGLSRWSVSRAVGELERLEAIEVERRHHKSTLYTICFNKDPASFRSSQHPEDVVALRTQLQGMFVAESTLS